MEFGFLLQNLIFNFSKNIYLFGGPICQVPSYLYTIFIHRIFLTLSVTYIHFVDIKLLFILMLSSFLLLFYTYLIVFLVISLLLLKKFIYVKSTNHRVLPLLIIFPYSPFLSWQERPVPPRGSCWTVSILMFISMFTNVVTMALIYYYNINL